MENAKFLEKNHALSLRLVSDGTTGEQWIKRLEDQGHILSLEIKSLLRSSQFVATKDRVLELVILKKTLEKALILQREEVLAEARTLHLVPVNLETACLLREELSLNWLSRLNLQRVLVFSKDSDLAIFGSSHFRGSLDTPRFLRAGCFGYVFRRPDSNELSCNGWDFKIPASN
ncbi:hypothetical protein EOL72_00400 [Candidatus Falkowbacteria bacterium]|nr:hypothetical protein [Candidatus Falkowbacteria bacterium]